MIAEQPAIRDKMLQYERTWNAHDAGALVCLFAEDADFTTASGQKLQGRKAIFDHCQTLYSTIYKNSIITITDISIRILHPGIAAVDARQAIHNVKGMASPNRSTLINLVMMEIGDQWQIVVMHATEVQMSL